MYTLNKGGNTVIYNLFCGENISRLGMGNMRLPVKPGEGEPIDYAKAQEIIDYAMTHGINYFDTAYTYHGGGSEKFLGTALKNYPRETYYLATKFNYGANPDYKTVLKEQLESLQTDYIDFYLLHGVGIGSNWIAYRDCGCIDYFLEMKEKGVIKHLGFSFHGTLDCLREIVAHHQWDFCQLQMNYYDWLYADTKQEYAIAEEAGLPVVVMESLRGGLLASLSPEAEAILKAAHPNWSIASWALRWLQRHPNVKVMLSGMSALDQIVDNVATCGSDSALTDADVAVLYEACERFRSNVLVPCTGCRYCVDTCPAQINIPEVLKVYNDHKDIPWTFMGLMRAGSKGKPMDCVSCGLCTEHCPQGIDVPRYMAALTEKLMPNHKK